MLNIDKIPKKKKNQMCDYYKSNLVCQDTTLRNNFVLIKKYSDRSLSLNYEKLLNNNNTKTIVYRDCCCFQNDILNQVKFIKLWRCYLRGSAFIDSLYRRLFEDNLSKALRVK